MPAIACVSRQRTHDGTSSSVCASLLARKYPASISGLRPAHRCSFRFFARVDRRLCGEQPMVFLDDTSGTNTLVGTHAAASQLAPEARGCACDAQAER